MGVCCAEGGGRGRPDPALEPIDRDLQGEPAGDGVGEAAAGTAVDGCEGTRVGRLARREIDARTLLGETAQVLLRGGADAAAGGEHQSR